MKQIEQVKQFHKTFGQPILDTPQIPEKGRCELRYALIAEELEEFKEAYEANDIVGVADALTDLLYVVLGSHNEFGLHAIAEKLFDEVQRSNMSKLDENGQVIYKPNGKVAKSDLFSEPDLKSIVERVMENKPIKIMASTAFGEMSFNCLKEDRKMISEKWGGLGLLDGLNGHVEDRVAQLFEANPYFVINEEPPIMSDEEAEKEFPPFKVKPKD
jgi:predicted HAD superfamily Cof-like phosphohydrolase